MEVEDSGSLSGGISDSEVCVLDKNDDEDCYVSGEIPKLQFRKDAFNACWRETLEMAEVAEMKGQMWRTTGIVRNSKTYFSIEETLFLVEIGALRLLDEDDTPLCLEHIYKKVAEGKSECSWESFQVYRHLKSLGYIVVRHGIPWTLKNVKDVFLSLGHTPQMGGMIDRNSEHKVSIIELFNDMQINEMRPLFDVYPPNNKFKKSCPGSPSFVLCLSSEHPPTKRQIEDLQRRCNGIPLKFCQVDHGRVNFFSFTGLELPVLP